ncbi:SDR family NAD(P)-dependent oxidoreductase [Paenibacillus sacheonensis]|uniref:SDR family NAD(P)-dependent oxidoreductase n=1 Tax=Paenibacillus sacheonensis TaxID=742054 RepID=A0A7X5C1D8_9BACL|nr:SDR family NAD(P)-dependent oxidoreductase [Paenibacillus sacheonensis]MBM7565061.1 NAD(P)-dependent dehydrogenase (short-subunit alcohol dehydrogenase family) [Paenibacillus sacheonensis]NBC70155.1 SDR family NAD(P)-dependent oxidoreductase [Paenibacillus sacheonensis]
MPRKRQVCITGTDRGIGLELVKGLLQDDCIVYAGGILSPNPELERLKEQYPGQLHDFLLDVGSDVSVQEAAERIRSLTPELDMLINNAALLGDTGHTIADTLDFDEIQRVYNVTALGAIRTSNALLAPIMNGGKLIVNISSEAGSIGNSGREAWFGYCMAKSALNMGSTIIHNRIRKEGGRVLLLHPGWVKTSMSGSWNDAGTFTPQEAAANLLNRIEERRHELRDLPLYIEADTGSELPW